MKLLALLTLAGVLGSIALVQAGISDDDGYLYEHRQRLGHFKDDPFTDVYKIYAAYLVVPSHPDHDDFRNYLPALEECITFFTGFRRDKYKVNSIEEFVLLDACLGYLYESEYHALDIERNPSAEKSLNDNKGDENLVKLYEGSKVDQLESRDAKKCIADLLITSVMLRSQFPNDRCNSDYIQLYLQFAECQKDIPSEARQTDTYVQALYGLVRDRAQACFDEERLTLERETRAYYKRSYATRMSNSILSKLSHKRAQQGQRMWPTPIVKILSAVQNTDDQISLRQVHQLLRGFYVDEPKLKGNLLRNFGLYADKVIEPNKKTNKRDPFGTSRYQEKVVNDLCNFFRSQDNDRQFDFARSVIRLVQLLKHEDVFGISYKNFINKLLTSAEETAPMYLSISACNILTFTEGSLSPPARGKVLNYKVTMTENTDQMVQWPTADYY